jgi:hypothetical protein
MFNKMFWEELIAYFPLYDTDRIENDAYIYFSIVIRFVYIFLLF